ncbi:MAG TPA: thioredoxin family protein [Chthoniobacteraceae bacterium]|nr:thioredoxin family protein [Chthoniobacteraceae bacterium]
MKTLRLNPLRLFLLFAVIGGIALQGNPFSRAASGVEWRTDGAAVLKAKQDRPILLRFTASWCPPCRVMNANVWPNAEVAGMVNQHFIPVELDIDQPEVREIADRFEIIAVPTMVLLNGNGKELDRANFMDVRETMKFLEQARKP